MRITLMAVGLAVVWGGSVLLSRVLACIPRNTEA